MSITPKNYVIFDCNGSSDDGWALALLLKADSVGKVKLLAITCAPGPLKVDRVARNMYQILQTKQRGDIPIYLFPGSRFMPNGYDTNFHNHYDQHKNHRHGKDAFENILGDDLMHERTIQAKHAVHAITDLVNLHRNEVTIICTGPLTNVALSLAIYGAEFAARIKALYIMGGAYQAVGNVTRAAEFNFNLDPEAAEIVLARAKCPITILPWEACSKERFNISADWRFNVLGANENDDFIKFMNRLERGMIGSDGRHADWIPYDSMIVAVFLLQIHFVGTESRYNAKVELFGKYSRGEMILDHLKDLVKNPLNATIVEKVDAEMFKLIAMWAAGYRGADSDYIQGLL